MKYKRILRGGEIENYFSVSTLDLRYEHLAFFHDYDEGAGKWGLIDSDFNEKIAPKYLFPLYFRGPYSKELSIAAKGEWRYDDEWKFKNKNYAGWWTDEEKWGIIDIHENAVLPFEYNEIRAVGDSEFFGYAVWKKVGKEWKMALFDKSAEQLTDFIYRDCDYDLDGGYLVISSDGELWNKGAKCGVYDFNKKEVLIEPKYNFLEIIDGKNGVFYVSEDYENGFHGHLIDRDENKIGNYVFRTDPSTLGIDSGNGYERLPEGVYRGELESGLECYFRVKDNTIDILRQFATVFITKNDFDAEKISKNSGVFWDVADHQLHKSAVDAFAGVNYNFLHTWKGGDKDSPDSHIVRGYVYAITACYLATEEDNLDIIGHSEEPVEHIGDGASKNQDNMPLVGWKVILYDVVVDEQKPVWSTGCDGVTMTLISIDDCVADGEPVNALEGFPQDLAELFDFIEFEMSPSRYRIENDTDRNILSPLLNETPLLNTVDYYNHTILPYDVVKDFKRVEKYAREKKNSKIENLAHEAWKFIEEGFKKYDHPHCYFVLFDGV